MLLLDDKNKIRSSAVAPLMTHNKIPKMACQAHLEITLLFAAMSRTCLRLTRKSALCSGCFSSSSSTMPRSNFGLAPICRRRDITLAHHSHFRKGIPQQSSHASFPSDGTWYGVPDVSRILSRNDRLWRPAAKKRENLCQ